LPIPPVLVRARSVPQRTFSADPSPPSSPLTSPSRAPSQGVEEDHRFEQFFYDDATTERLFKIATRYQRPAFLCTPSLAARAERANLDYLLLDRDARWKSRLGANKFKQFELTEPRQLRFPYDVVFCDPPFSNVEMRSLRRTIDLLAATDAQRASPVWLCFVRDREDELLDAFEGYDLERKPPALGYMSVKEETQERIFLYGPKGQPGR
jgi:16S rRNA G966 N2-methylase RsmD